MFQDGIPKIVKRFSEIAITKLTTGKKRGTMRAVKLVHRPLSTFKVQRSKFNVEL